MKRTFYLFFILFTIPFFSFAQTIENVDFVSMQHDEMIAVKKGNQWAFINNEGNIAINYRDDLVTTATENGDYPLFENGRCLIIKKKDDISYFGYIDKTGKTVIEPQYLNARNFQNDIAIVLVLKRTEITKNVALDKPVVSYDYFEVAIDLNGNNLKYLTLEPTHVTLSPEYLRKPPKITAKFVSKTLVAVMDKQQKWSVVAIDKN